jgi:uncharacterized membrane protein
MIAVVAGGMGGGSRRFAPFHRWDRTALLVMIAAMWLGIVMGFVPEIAGHIAKHEPAYPLIVHLHAAAFVGWMALLTTQVLLMRVRRPDLHRRLGLAGPVLAAIMIVLGPATALTVQRLAVGHPDADPAFLSVQFGGILAFGALATAAFLLRGDASSHKRLILLATLGIIDAGFARWLGAPMTKWLGPAGYWQNFAELYAGSYLLLVSFGAYDLITRRRLHPAYVIGAGWIVVVQLAAIWLYLSPAWKAFAIGLIGR